MGRVGMSQTQKDWSGRRRPGRGWGHSGGWVSGEGKGGGEGERVGRACVGGGAWR